MDSGSAVTEDGFLSTLRPPVSLFATTGANRERPHDQLCGFAALLEADDTTGTQSPAACSGTQLFGHAMGLRRGQDVGSSVSKPSIVPPGVDRAGDASPTSHPLPAYLTAVRSDSGHSFLSVGINRESQIVDSGTPIVCDDPVGPWRRSALPSATLPQQVGHRVGRN